MSFISTLFSFGLLFLSVNCQLAGTQTPESHPKLAWKKCAKGGCATQPGEVVLEADYRWLHNKEGYNDCQPQGKWNATLCPDPITCAKNCAIEGVGKYDDYGIETKGDALTLKMNTKNGGYGQRIYFMGDDKTYQIFKLPNQEFTFDVEMGKLPCGTNGALYFSEMDFDGGISKYSTNQAGAKYGTGYCDAQCPKSLKFIHGEATTEGKYGACCNEMDIWEANKIATAYTPHPCTQPGVYRCSGKDCGDGADKSLGVCDKPGCDLNAYRMGNQKFYGPGVGMTLNTEKKMTVVTQFLTKDHSTTGPLVEIRRLYVQDGQVIEHSQTSLPGLKAYDSISDQFCVDRAKVFGEKDDTGSHGGLKVMGESGARGMVLVFALWDDSGESAMQWLDGARWPKDAPVNALGAARGSCDGKESAPATIHKLYPDAGVTFSNIRFGDIGSTFGHRS
ncbi:glycoside hydrolase family 7 protein [Tothia fuscella]|uniref:Glucanase n=1 Tax=Tothia fuscella TaxID=1048955 RepID=A0A9P4NTQ3_9PEZI|nr:glycoside hydrolase family 7 protein [Tothia fuscella]